MTIRLTLTPKEIGFINVALVQLLASLYTASVWVVDGHGHVREQCKEINDLMVKVNEAAG